MNCPIENPANHDLSDLEPHVHGMYDHFASKYGFDKHPTMVFDSDEENKAEILGKTAYYDPQNLEIHVFVDGRHSKDILRSIAHELIHHKQNLEGRLDVGGYSGPGYYLENDKLKEVEHEAMLEGNATMREYEDTVKYMETKNMSLKEWKNNELNGLLLKKFGILKEAKGEKGDANPLGGERAKFDKDHDGVPDGADKDKNDPEVQEEAHCMGKRDDELEEGGAAARHGNENHDVGKGRMTPDRIHEEELEEGKEGYYLLNPETREKEGPFDSFDAAEAAKKSGQTIISPTPKQSAAQKRKAAKFGLEEVEVEEGRKSARVGHEDKFVGHEERYQNVKEDQINEFDYAAAEKSAKEMLKREEEILTKLKATGDEEEINAQRLKLGKMYQDVRNQGFYMEENAQQQPSRAQELKEAITKIANAKRIFLNNKRIK